MEIKELVDFITYQGYFWTTAEEELKNRKLGENILNLPPITRQEKFWEVVIKRTKQRRKFNNDIS